MKSDQAFIVAALVAAAVFWSRRAEAATVDYAENPAPADDWFSGVLDDPTDYGSTGDPYNPGDDFVTINETTSPDDRVNAFLWMIGAAETSPAAMASGAAFRTFYGGSLFSNLSDHPVITGEKVGVPLPDEWCRKAGLNPPCTSSAAGAYQINLPTWGNGRKLGVRDASPLWGPRLPDFSPESQMEGARRLLIMDGVLPYVQRGEFETAVRRASRRWASLPGSTAGQGGRSMAWLTGIYGEALGVA